MSAFRTEMYAARDHSERLHKFVPASNLNTFTDVAVPSCLAAQATNAYTDGTEAGPRFSDDYDEWPDEFLMLGVAEQDDVNVDFSPESETSTTSETQTTEDTEEGVESLDDAWPIELL